MSKGNTIQPVILSGGAGTRLWPLSRQAAPKQFHCLTSDHSLFQETILRLADGKAGFAPPIVLASLAHENIVREQLAAIGVAPAAIILEPVSRNTAPAIAAATLAAQRAAPEAILAVLPADHMIADAAGFRDALLRGAACAAEGRIVTLGITPTRPETGYGYIRGGEMLEEHVRAVLSFEEKPDADTAAKYVAAGDYYWNAGIFLFRPEVMIAEMREHCPAVLDAAARALDKARDEKGRILLDAEAFAAAENISIDYAVMERTKRAAVVATDVGWSDIGSWAALWEVSEKGASGNANSGEGALTLACRDTLTISDGPRIAAIGVSDLVIVATADAVLVTRRDLAQEVKKVVEKLKADQLLELL